MHPDIATAIHNIYAIRLEVDGKITEYSDDDGEYGGGFVILKALKDRNVTNRLVVVSRQASDHKLGRRRWEIINQCTSEVV